MSVNSRLLQLKDFPLNNHVKCSLSKRINKQMNGRQGVSLSFTLLTYSKRNWYNLLAWRMREPSRRPHYKKIYHWQFLTHKMSFKQTKHICNPPRQMIFATSPLPLDLPFRYLIDSGYFKLLFWTNFHFPSDFESWRRPVKLVEEDQ